MKLASTALAGLMILVAPWLIGGNYLYFRTVLLVVTAVFGLMGALSCLVERKRFRTSLLWLVLPIAAAYGIYQTLPASGPISIYPSASKAQLYVLGSAIALFLASSVHFREMKTIEPLMVCIALVGFAIAFVGVAQNLGWNGKILWVYELLYGGVPFGPFVNKNNGAGFLILSVAGPLYFLAKQFLKGLPKERSSSSGSDEFVLSSRRKKRRKFRPFQLVTSFIANLEAKHLYCLTGLVAIVAGVFLSFSRGGSISIVVGLSAGLLLLMIANRWAVVLAGFIIACCIGTAVWTEQADAVQKSLASIAEADEKSAARLLHWKDAASYYKAHWLLGSGLGTYRYEYPVFQQQPFQGKFAHAENVYLETLAELGVVGVVALLLTMLVICHSSIKLFRQPRIPDRALGVAATASFVGLAAASCLDFGIYQPANFILASVLFGSVVGRASHPECQSATRSTKKGLPTNYFRFGVLLLLVLASAYAAFPSAAIESVQFAKRQLALHVQNKGDSVHRIRKAERALLFAEKYLPQDWQTQYLLGQCEIFKHRQTLTEQVKVDTEAIFRQQALEAGLSEDELEDRLPPRSDYWLTTSMLNLHRVMRLAESQNPTTFAEMRNDPTVITPELKKAWDYFRAALERSDRSERVHFRLAQLTVMMGDPEGNLEAESQHVANAREMAKGYTGLSYDAGLLCMHSGNFEEAAEHWVDCLSRSRQYEGRIVRFGLGLPGKLYFEKVLPQNPEDLLRLSRKHFSTDDQKVPNELLLVHTRRLIKSSNHDDVQKSVLNGQAWFLAKEYQKACEEFERVLETEPNRPKWRLDYANCLVGVGRYDDAIREMKICQLEQPESASKIARLVERTKRERISQRIKANEPSDSADPNTITP
jgi:tetratricopeptide (TPR) repeat protein